MQYFRERKEKKRIKEMLLIIINISYNELYSLLMQQFSIQ